MPLSHSYIRMEAMFSNWIWSFLLQFGLCCFLLSKLIWLLLFTRHCVPLYFYYCYVFVSFAAPVTTNTALVSYFSATCRYRGNISMFICIGNTLTHKVRQHVMLIPLIHPESTTEMLIWLIQNMTPRKFLHSQTLHVCTLLESCAS